MKCPGCSQAIYNKELATNARTAAGEGFTAIKFDPIPVGYGDMTQDALVRGVTERVAAARRDCEGRRRG